MSRYPDCIICGEPVVCGQGRAHFSCVGMCQRCFQRPAAGPGYDDPDRCGDRQPRPRRWPRPGNEPSPRQADGAGSA